MSRRDKLIEKMRITPKNIRFGQVASLLRHEGFVLFNKATRHNYSAFLSYKKSWSRRDHLGKDLRWTFTNVNVLSA